jgi:hypothetical protein
VIDTSPVRDIIPRKCPCKYSACKTGVKEKGSFQETSVSLQILLEFPDVCLMNKITIFISYFETAFAIRRLIHILARYRTACSDRV